MALDHDARNDDLSEEECIDDAEVDTMVRESITQVIGDASFHRGKMDIWMFNIMEGVLKRLASLQKPFKYVVTCDYQQKAGAGLHVACCSRWSQKMDGKLSDQWENGTIFALVTVYWVAV